MSDDDLDPRPCNGRDERICADLGCKSEACCTLGWSPPEWSAERARQRGRLTYAFGHLVGSFAYPDDAHAGDSFDLAEDELATLGIHGDRLRDLIVLAEHVAFRYKLA